MQGLDRDAILWSTPERERAGRPLLVLLHGLRSDERDLFGLSPYLPLEFVIASVRAPLAVPPGHAWFPERWTPETVDEGADALLGWLAELTGFSSVGLLGFSQGGAVAVHALRRRPDAADYAVNLAGFTIHGDQPGDAELAELRPPVFWGRGLDDEVIAAGLVELTAQWLPHHATVTGYGYQGLGHAVSAEEIEDVNGFLRAHAR